ncbi:MAG: insulinase family protein [Acidimicrobiales bacterium]
MHRQDIDGVAVLWADRGEPYTGSLTFGVGRRDETFVTGGITHLVEHLAMSALAPSHLDRNASVDDGVTRFTATGKPEAVGQFLSEVASVLADLPTDRLALEASILEVEGPGLVDPTTAVSLARRYGARGVGLVGFVDAAVGAISAADVRAHAARYFVADNAVAWFTGPPPEGLTLPLPRGELNLPVRPESMGPSGPGVVVLDQPGVGLSFEAPESEAVLTGCRILLSRLTEELRTRRGLSYHLGLWTSRLDLDHWHVSITADCRPGDAVTVAAEMYDGLRRLAESGPTDDELAHDLDGMRSVFDDPRSAADELDMAAGRMLQRGQPLTHDELLAEHLDLTGETVAAALKAVLDDVVVAVPVDTDPSGVPLPVLEPPRAAPADGQTFARRLTGSKAPFGARLVVGGDGVSLRMGPETITVRYGDLVGCGRAPGAALLVAADGTSLVVHESDWRKGSAALASIDAAVPASLVFPARPDQLGG